MFAILSNLWEFSDLGPNTPFLPIATMMMHLTSLCLVLAVLFSPGCGAKDDDASTLQFVVVIYRHGDRTPINPYPTDPYKDVTNW